MTREPRHHYSFKRLETDDEYRSRLLVAGVDPWKLAGKKDKELDDAGWSQKQMQRRIVDDVA